ncbi:MAG: acyl-CoA dehydrogenase [Flavobacteriaceae bacterium]|nr:acyl-CoA dehydrogenase [Flavobacteriaceae bacterium]PHX83804.1 MAG: acyl-CoA dehydrogenase [Flavobacteriales bacterium]
MNYPIEAHQSEELDLIRASAAEFAAQHIAPHVMEWDEAQVFPKELFHEMGRLGFLGVLISTEYGGAGMGYAEYITIVDEISQVCGSIGLSVAAHNSLCTQHINQFGTEEQKRRWLPKLASGQWIGAWGLTETGTGSDAGGMHTTAVRDGDGWRINGSKNFITHAISGDVAVVVVRTGEKGDSHGMSAFVVEKGTPGFEGGRKENKLGMRASETAGLFFDNCYVSNDNLLGKVGEGFIQSMKILDGGRISIAALSVGIAKGAQKAALRYSREREQFGQPIGDFQGIAFKLAEMGTKIYASELMTRHAGSLKDQGRKVTRESAMAKLFASETAVEVATDGVQIHGGYGYTKDYPAEKYFRDSKLCTIGEGTSEIQKLVISRDFNKA